MDAYPLCEPLPQQKGYSKATAVVELMAVRPFAGRRPIFMGDDTTDEAVFPVVRALNGIGLSVGNRAKDATGCFARAADVREWLDSILAGHVASACSSPRA
jgi:trehalose 6-phosphate phosphatase